MLSTCGIEKPAWIRSLRTGFAHPWLKSSHKCSVPPKTHKCVLLLVCLPHCVITFIADVEHRGQCSPGSVGVQTSGSTNHRALSGPLELWVMLFFSLKYVMQFLFLFFLPPFP